MALSRNLDQRRVERPFNATASVAASTTNIALVTITARNEIGRAVPYAVFDVFLSDSAAGADVTATTASGAVTAGTSGGAVLGILTTKKVIRVQANASGVFILSITDSAKTAFKVAVVLDGLTTVVATLATASYG